MAQYRSSGSPTIRAAPTNRNAGLPKCPATRLPGIGRKTRAWCSIGYSSSRSLYVAHLIAHNGNEQVGDAGRAHVAQVGELFGHLLTIHSIEQQDAAAEHLALVYRPQRPCCGEPLGIHRNFQVARFQFFHAATEYNFSAIYEHHISENVLDFFHLMGGHDDRAVAIEVVVQQGIVELLTK